ncbi:hypothetical protein [Mesorhizobium sp. 1M-11]|uniref:hypothetical protein n=1 Tax=Mesorhizobium sp. 1M-11 TaxID=1529006 RepID=UPI0006C75337|nr:hypothetical protein [Mesorhizobium sp. 1M-11]
MGPFSCLLTAGILSVGLAGTALAQEQAPAPQDAPAATSSDSSAPATTDGDEKPAPVPFAGGTFTITEQPEMDKILAYDGKEIARDYYVGLDQIVKVAGIGVALFNVGSGGNQCGPATIIAWKPEGSATLQSVRVEQDECGAPPTAVAENAIYFVPYLMPGDSNDALQWSPQDGLQIAGRLTYKPQPNTGWTDIDPSKYQNIIDAFHNEAVYEAAEKLLGDQMGNVATSLLVGGGTEKTPSGAFYATGCVPHACGGSNGFMAVDVKNKALYFAQQTDKPEPNAWPALKDWPDEIKDALKKALQQPQ